MNIFVLDYNLEKCAQYHCDRHVVKMILESAQMLSTALRMNGIVKGYRPTHINHPCTVWTRRSLSNWKWLRNLAKHLNSEYRFRFRKVTNHVSWNLISSLPDPPIEDIGLTKFAQVMPSIYKSVDTVTAYRKFYLGEKMKILSWTGRETPGWVF
tara:strand:+ start:252 stop:713 length:462 start_codon:yes stop_codon:yes gene_type:complete